MNNNGFLNRIGIKMNDTWVTIASEHFSVSLLVKDDLDFEIVRLALLMADKQNRS